VRVHKLYLFKLLYNYLFLDGDKSGRLAQLDLHERLTANFLSHVLRGPKDLNVGAHWRHLANTTDNYWFLDGDKSGRLAQLDLHERITANLLSHVLRGPKELNGGAQWCQLANMTDNYRFLDGDKSGRLAQLKLRENYSRLTSFFASSVGPRN